MSNQFWPEVQYQQWFGDRTRAIGMTAVSRDLASESSNQAEEGLIVEHRFAIEQTFGLHMAGQIIAHYRTREDLRWLDTGLSVRIRECIQLQRDCTVDGYPFTPYASAEVFFDTLYGRFAGYRLTADVTLSIYRHFSLEPYLVRQVDYAGSFAITNAVDLILISRGRGRESGRSSEASLPGHRGGYCRTRRRPQAAGSGTEAGERRGMSTREITGHLR